MILQEIHLSNFRCFYGDARIRFSCDPGKNVTIIYAENGVGKTTLLNALLWCFYGETTDRFEKREEIVNYDAVNDGRTTASVEISFEHEDQQYIAKRFASADSSLSKEFALVRVTDGSQISLATPEVFINTVIPRDMASHFLFDGEHAEVFLAESNRGSIRGAVRDILGCSMIQTAIDDLKDVARQFRRNIPATPATKRIAEFNRQLDSLTMQTEEAKSSIERLKKSRSQKEQQVTDIDNKLRQTAAAKELQQHRDHLSAQLLRAQKRKEESSDEVYRWLGQNGRFIVSMRIADETFSFLDDEEHRGRIPSPYNEEFVNDLLEAEQCICGAHLKPGSPERRKVASLLERAANQVVRDRISKVRARLSDLKSGRKKAPGILARAHERLAEANEEFDSAEAKLAEISGKLKGIKFDEIAEREQRRDDLRNEIRDIDRNIGSLTINVQNTERDAIRISAEITRLAKEDEQTIVFGRRLSLCEDIKSKLEQQLSEEENDARKVLRASIRRILERTTRKVLNLRMTDDYVISLVNSDGTSLPKSSGENQLLGLAFTAALIEFAKVRDKAEDYRLLPGTIAPLVLDSPFGQLDETYRATTAEFIPQMARQVVLLVSKSQGSEDVLSALHDYLGAEYLLVRHNKEPAGNRRSERRHLAGKDFATVMFDSQYDGTEIVELPR